MSASSTSTLDELERRVLRLSEEPCTHHSEAQIHHRLLVEPHAYIGFVRALLLALCSGEASLELPAKQLFPDPAGGDFRVMPAVVRWRGESCATVKVVGTNLRQQQVPGQITVGRALALDPDEHFVSDLFDICLLSSIRTGLCAALAGELLAPDSRRLLLFGGGRVAYYCGVLLGQVMGLEEIVVIDPLAERAANCASLLQRELPSTRVSGETTVRPDQQSDIVVLATDAREALCEPPGYGAKLIVSVGADCDQQSELSDSWPGVAAIYVDLPDSARFGDLKRWLQRGLVRPERVTDLLTLLKSGQAPTDGQKLFISTGSALFDNLTIAYLLGRWAGSSSQFPQLR
ncbi:MAG: hypothetical protein J4A00_10580 [Gammaproteobacteria bacterium]|nr:hypothetical protein [Gammaproteobacteria bacterium]